jgi:hypothetical protein
VSVRTKSNGISREKGEGIGMKERKEKNHAFPSKLSTALLSVPSIKSLAYNSVLRAFVAHAT